MNKKEIHRHCPEVENMMGGKMPFITRYGIALVAFSFLVVALLLMSEGTSLQLMKEMVKHVMEQLMSKYN